MITFNPPLTETTILNVPFHPGNLTFTATGQLDPRTTIQIWSDIPDNSQTSISREQQGWFARSFQFQQNSSVASLSIPFLDFIHPSRTQFSFTYRILHPDGGIQWLGDFGRNGTLIVNRYDDRLVLFGGWSTNLGPVFTPKSAIKSPLQVFSLSDKIQWRCWDLSTGAPRLLSVDDGPSHIQSALLVPSQPKEALIPLSPVFLTSKDVQVTINPGARSVYITSPSKGGLLSLQTLAPDVLISSITAALPSAVSIPDPDNRYACFLVNPDRTPARLFVIPLSADFSVPAPSTLSLPLSHVLSRVQFLSNGSSSHFSISNPTRFISTSADHIQLAALDFGGAQFFLSPVYDLVKPDGDVHLSVLSKHTRLPNQTNHSLLTPPPSPPLNPIETETQPLRLPDGSQESPDQVPAVHIHHVDDKPTEPALTSGQSTPSPDVHEQLASGQTTPKPRPSPSDSSDVTLPVKGVALKKLICFVLRILTFYPRIILLFFAQFLAFNVPKRELVATPNVKIAELDDDQGETKPTSVSSALHTPTFLTPRRQHSGASTPVPHSGDIDSVGQDVPDVTETLEAVTTKIVPELITNVGEEEKPQENLADPCVQEPKPGHDEKWEVVHRPGISFELGALPSSPVATEGDTPPKTRPIRLTLDGAESVIKGIKFHLDDVEVADVKIEPLTGTGQEGLWTAEVPRMSRDLITLRIS